MSRKSLVSRGTCNNGHPIESEKDLYITPYNHKNQGLRVDKRCRACQLERARVISRKKRGITPANAPVRAYAKQKRRPRPVIDLIKAVGNDGELANYLLSVARYAKLAQELQQEQDV